MSSKWLFPSDIDELVGLLERDNPLVHGGGTGIPRGRVRSSKVVVDLGRMGWNRCYEDGKNLLLGATCTFSRTVEQLSRIRPGHILVSALSRAASTPLRNRITLGGSVAFFPLWSDLMGPLLALGASVDLVGTVSGRYPIEHFVSNRGLFRGAVIRSVVVPDLPVDSWYYREVRVGFDYPGFTMTLLAQRDGDILANFRGVCVGTKERFKVLKGVSESLKGIRYGDVDVNAVAEKLELDFPDKKSGSGEYFGQVAKVWFERGLAELLER
ncbi:molybdopterin dehydrogenase FAD-binding [Dethiosulfovibrio peptidovorans DSM 11002]|uniref:Molybdopterin dehydrogenase FAD-binding n=1 Tax=Dethiosulfovibrio peptidovorans DSM 11002 TaxID=469381 RepID=D2Z8P8_9BACT|nr:FAD binding domain-containing protein [Dethiosulfovibrio peptidovorans]EFC91845.1 molybdopterin dehydrogenase FAD-binding [Dethiosulfovibrio peptidovorans DSM 11002]